MSITVREMQPADAPRFLEVHHAAIRGIASSDYPSPIIDAWAWPITHQRIERFLKNSDGETRLVAEMAGEIVGVGSIVVANSELRACYVAPGAVRCGVGSALVREIERIAREQAL